jgi:hypothetical protein
MKQCTMLVGEARCEEWGEPEPGFKFYLCPACCDHLQDLLELEAIKRSALVNPMGRMN